MNKKRVSIVVCVAAVAGLARCAAAQDLDLASLASRIGSLESGQESIQKELLEIKGLLQTVLLQTAFKAGEPSRVPAPQPQVDLVGARVRVAEAASLGDPAAKVGIVEFSDFECPYCGRHARESLPQIVQSYIRTGQVKILFP